MTEALIFDTHRATSHDGEGLRTTFFFQGCPLRCRWCHNPEGISREPYMKWDAKKCIDCRKCAGSCPEKALFFTGEGILIDRARCTCCEICSEGCPAKALKISAKSWSVDMLVKYARKDRHFYDAFHGGVTLSGGEATLYPPFIAKAAERLQSEGINVALDTSGYCEADVFESLFPKVDCILFDLKFADESRHREFTGAGNCRILDNFSRIVQAKKDGTYSGELWIRTPVVPNATDSECNILAIAGILNTHSDMVDRWELCAFNNMCKDKYRNLGIDWEYMESGLLPDSKMRSLLQTANKAIGGRFPVLSSGLTAKEQ
jgi:pyruvate formate lyase activating enzyme